MLIFIIIMYLIRWSKKKGVGSLEGMLGFNCLVSFVLVNMYMYSYEDFCTAERMRILTSPLIFALRFFLLYREHLLKINLWNEDHSWGFIHSPPCQLFGLAKSVTGKCGKTGLIPVISRVMMMMMMES